MEKIIVDKCSACEPINRLINDLKSQGFVIKEEKVSDFHFHELYLKLVGDLNKLKNIDVKGFSVVDNKYICNCHWSTVEIDRE